MFIYNCERWNTFGNNIHTIIWLCKSCDIFVVYHSITTIILKKYLGYHYTTFSPCWILIITNKEKLYIFETFHFSSKLYSSKQILGIRWYLIILRTHLVQRSIIFRYSFKFKLVFSIFTENLLILSPVGNSFHVSKSNFTAALPFKVNWMQYLTHCRDKELSVFL